MPSAQTSGRWVLIEIEKGREKQNLNHRTEQYFNPLLNSHDRETEQLKMKIKSAKII